MAHYYQRSEEDISSEILQVRVRVDYCTYVYEATIFSEFRILQIKFWWVDLHVLILVILKFWWVDLHVVILKFWWVDLHVLILVILKTH